MTDQRPCSCGGSNENCNICYGRGFVEGGYRTKEFPVGSHRKLIRTTTRFSTQSCPLCNSQVREDKLRAHMTKRCPQRTATSSTLNPMKCPACDFTGNTDELSRHFLLAHGIREIKGQKHGRIRLPIARVAGSSHPVRIEKRKKKKKQNTAAATAQHSANMSRESLRHKGKIEAEIPSWRNNLDATKDYGYPARESGRYGSHPSHDGFDDESKP